MLKLQAGESDVDVDDCTDSLEDDWADDACGKEYMLESDFFNCWFQV